MQDEGVQDTGVLARARAGWEPVERRGKEMDAESRAADRTVRALIREAMDKGLARPAPQA